MVKRPPLKGTLPKHREVPRYVLFAVPTRLLIAMPKVLARTRVLRVPQKRGAEECCLHP